MKERNRYWVKAPDGLTLVKNPAFQPTLWDRFLREFFPEHWRKVHLKAHDLAFIAEYKHASAPLSMAETEELYLHLRKKE